MQEVHAEPAHPTDHNTSFQHAENFPIVKPLAVMAIKYKRIQDSDDKPTCAFAESMVNEKEVRTFATKMRCFQAWL